MNLAALSPGVNDDPFEEFTELAKRTLELLESESDLSPRNRRVSNQLSAFVSAVLNVSPIEGSADLLERPEIRNIRSGLLGKLSEAEYKMELYFGEGFASRPDLSCDDLGDFRYRQCYIDLVKQEVMALLEAGLEPGPDKTIVFVGSGPLPLTAIDMYMRMGARIVCVDNDPDAVSISKKMISNLGLSSVIDVCHSEGDIFDYSESDIVFVASLVGEKDNVIARIRTTAPRTHVAVRSVEGLKAMLYEPVPETAFSDNGLMFYLQSQDGTETINSTMLFRPAVTVQPPPRNVGRECRNPGAQDGNKAWQT